MENFEFWGGSYQPGDIPGCQCVVIVSVRRAYSGVRLEVSISCVREGAQAAGGAGQRDRLVEKIYLVWWIVTFTT